MQRFRKLLLLTLVLTLGLTTAGSALAEKGPHGPDRGRGQSDVQGASSAAGHEDQGLRARSLHGDIQAISGTIWTIERSGHKGGTFMVDMAGATVRWPEREGATLSEFHVGDKVNVQLERGRRGKDAGNAPSVLVARSVHFVPAKGHDEGVEHARFAGTVTAVSATSLAATNATLGARTFTLNSDTKVRLGSLAATLSDIHVGDTVTVTTDAGSLVALSVHIKLDRFRGSVTAASASSLTVNNPDLGSKSFTLSGSTQVRIGRDVATLADIHIADMVSVSTRPGDSAAILVVIRR
jgi:hypothetical protein